MATTFDCPSCGAPLTTDGKETSIQCEYCGATVIVPAELKQTLPAPPESTPAPEDHPSQMEGPHGKLTVAQMRQMMAHIRAGQLEDATKTFQEGTGASEEMVVTLVVKREQTFVASFFAAIFRITLVE